MSRYRIEIVRDEKDENGRPIFTGECVSTHRTPLNAARALGRRADAVILDAQDDVILYSWMPL